MVSMPREVLRPERSSSGEIYVLDHRTSGLFLERWTAPGVCVEESPVSLGSIYLKRFEVVEGLELEYNSSEAGRPIAQAIFKHFSKRDRDLSLIGANAYLSVCEGDGSGRLVAIIEPCKVRFRGGFVPKGMMKIPSSFFGAIADEFSVY